MRSPNNHSVVTKWSQKCHKVVLELSQPCPKLVPNLSQSCLTGHFWATPAINFYFGGQIWNYHIITYPWLVRWYILLPQCDRSCVREFWWYRREWSRAISPVISYGCFRLDICQKIYTTSFLDQKFYTVKTGKI